MTAFFNEIDAAAAASIHEVMADGLIAPGRIDTRSIKDLQPDDLQGFTQAHFFAGAGAWSYAARLAGWPDDRPIWTGSCPCQPFSQAGKRAGFADERHLWPDFHRLIGACRPPVVVGEQVSGAAGYAWLDGVAADLEREGYTCEAFDIPAAAVDAPHIRQRIYWVAVRNSLADADRGGRAGRQETSERQEGERASAERDHAPIGMAHTATPGEGWRQLRGPGEGGSADRQRPSGELAGSDGGGVTLGDTIIQRCDETIRKSSDYIAADGERSNDWAECAFGPRSVKADGSELGHSAGAGRFSSAHGGIHRGEEGDGPRHAEPQRRDGSFWSDAEWLQCHDGKARRTKPGLRLLVDGRPGRIHQWRIAGNQICIPLAVEFLKAVMEELA